MGIDWNLANGTGGFNQSVNAGVRAMQAFEAGQEARAKREARDAMAALAINPGDKAALSVVMRYDPAAGMKFAEYADRQQFRSALGDYIGGNALLGSGGATPALGSIKQPTSGAVGSVFTPGRNALAPLPPVQPGASFEEAFAPVAAQNAPEAVPEARESAMGGADLSFLGQPQDGRDKAFLRMLHTDPERALKIQSTMRDNFADRLKVEHDFYGAAIEELSAMHDDAGWQRALRRLAPMAQALGTDLLQAVPATFPGEEEVKRLLESALPAKERLDYFMRAANVADDNARADRNTDSLITHRDTLAGERERHNRAMEGNTRRGQNLTDARVRAGRGGGGSPRENLPVVSSPEEARKLPSGTRFKVKGTGQIKVVP